MLLENKNENNNTKKFNSNIVNKNKKKENEDSEYTPPKINKLLFNNNQNKIIINKPEIVLDKYNKNNIEFLIRLLFFEKKVLIKINNYSQISVTEEKGYFINYKLIDAYKNYYEIEKLKNILNNEEFINLFNKYKNKLNYISENDINKYLIEAMKYLPEEYIKEIQEKDNTSFKSELQKEELYMIEKKYHGEYYYFLNCNLINKYLFEYLLKYITENSIIKLLEQSEVKFVFIENQIIIVYDLILYIGNINNKNIFYQYMIIKCENKNDINSILNELKNNKIDNIIKNIKRKDNNVEDIGIYKKSIFIILDTKKYTFKKEESPKKISQNNYRTQENFYSAGLRKNKLKEPKNLNFINQFNLDKHLNQNKIFSPIKFESKRQHFEKNQFHNIKDKITQNQNNNCDKLTIKDNKMKKGVKNVIYIMIDKIRIKNKIKVKLNKESLLKQFINLLIKKNF